MPLQLSVSRNRKTSENYNSEGYGVSITVELDQSLLTRPGDLQGAIADLYHEAEAALEQQVNGHRGQANPTTSHLNRSGNGNGHGNNGGNGHQHGNRSNASATATSRNTSGIGGNSGGGGMTQSQRRAIHAICQKLNLDPAQEAQQVFQVQLEQLSVRDATPGSPRNDGQYAAKAPQHLANVGVWKVLPFAVREDAVIQQTLQQAEQRLADSVTKEMLEQTEIQTRKVLSDLMASLGWQTKIQWKNKPNGSQSN